MDTALRRISMREWETCDPQSSPALHGCFFSDARTAALAESLDHAGKLKVAEGRYGLTVSSTSFVGRLTLGLLEITIRPKIAGMALMTLLRYAFGLRELSLTQSADFSAAALGMQELLAHQLAVEAEQLLARGLQRTYRPRHENLAVPRGRIDMQRLAGQAGTASLELPCIWHPRTDDCLVNQILHQGLLLAARLSADLLLRGRLRRLAALLGATVSPLTLDWRALRRHRREANRLVAAYEPAITLIGLLLAGQGVTLEASGEELHLAGFLFDMNLLFEELLGRFLRENLVGYAVDEQHQLRKLFAYEPEHNPRNRKPPTPRPDYLVRKDTQPIAFLDAKYRDLWERELPRDMLYQLAIYALSHAAGDRASIIYPTLDPLAREARIQIREPLHAGSLGSVVIRPVRLDRLAALLERPEGADVRRERAALAHALVFGGQ